MPICDDNEKPYVGKTFKSIEEPWKFYKDYGYASGFDVRKGSSKKGKSGQIIYRHFVCIREGIHHGVNDESSGMQSKTKKRRRKPSSRNGCKARMIVTVHNESEYIVSSFTKAHNHKLISLECRHLMKYNRNVDASHQMIMLKCAKANIGPMRAFRVFKELVGSYEDIGCTSNYFKNLSYQMNSYPDGSDAQLLLDRLITKRDLEDGFRCEYLLDDCQKVKSIFWSDGIGLQNFSIFGEGVSFDATYTMNKYNMIFAPFTRKDNHGGCVTFAVGLLSREDVSSYSWILKQFVECMGRNPTMLITDQDPALKIAVEKVMPNTRHRFCMWHIMMKVAQKLPISLRDNAELTSGLYEVAWLEFDEPADFEEKWFEVINDYGLDDHSWFSDMFSLRKYWIPAFFRDLPMSGLFRTTSMSESENSFFHKFLNHNSNLASFYIHFESAMQAQRHSYKQLCMADQTTTPHIETHAPIEQHASRIYTKKIFLEVQVEIKEAFDRCRIKSMDTGDEVHKYVVDDRSNGIFFVTHNMLEDTIICSCKKFVKIGLVCRHMFVVMRNVGLKAIPQKYIVDRWLKDAGASAISSGGTKAHNRPLFSEAFRCISIAEGNEALTASLLSELKRWADANETPTMTPATAKERMFETFYGSKLPTEITVHPLTR
ncbi:protein FAR1-RELATED SEQUENCE 5-like [Salvia miltiorrhiza]|uniref:protein FAR1-RELATED SEQUENCE 5-like n=1 Tax=Salvia miltiorrhiza TaxID=226208 RepID=UPI0025AB6C98|nr:protein FAR1-RELATED SEQUENCE 5-like [Salvia miltiorrhiza]